MLFIILLVAVLGWMVYMMTCRTDDWIKLCKADEERKKAVAARMGGAAKASLGIARIFLKK